MSAGKPVSGIVQMIRISGYIKVLLSKREEERMKFTDKSSGFEITLPDNWRKLFIFERVKNNPFQGLLPRTLTEGPILISRDGDAMVIAVQQPESPAQSDYRDIANKIASETGLEISAFETVKIDGRNHTAVTWKSSYDHSRQLKTYFIIFGHLLWNITVLLRKDALFYDRIVETFTILPIVKKMME